MRYSDVGLLKLRARRSFDEHGYAPLVAHVDCSRAYASQLLGDYAESLKSYESALQTARNLGNVDLLSVILLVYLCFLSASFFERLLGKTGIIVLTRVLGMLLAALAVQFVLDGIKGFGFGG